MLTVDQRWIVAGASGAFFTFGFAPMFFLAVRRRWKSLGAWRQIMLTVIVSWVVISSHRLFIEIPVNTAYAHSQGNLMYDGVGGNVATLLIVAWFVPLLECSFLILAGFLYSRIKPKPPNQSTEPSIAPNEF